MVPWSPTWDRLLNLGDFAVPEAKEALDFILLSLDHRICPACSGQEFGPAEWKTAYSGPTETIVCLTCEIIWPPREVMERWDFEDCPEAAPKMGETLVMISYLARVIQKGTGDTACQQ